MSPKHSISCLTDSLTGAPVSASKIVGISRNLPDSLDEEVLLYHANSFATSTSKTYSTQQLTILRFFADIKISPVPLLQENLRRYIAFLSIQLCFNSVKQYLNIFHLEQLEAGLPNPLEKNWYVATILKGVRRVKGDASVQKLPDILKQIFLTLIYIVPLTGPSGLHVWWVSFHFFRKSNRLVSSHTIFDPDWNLCANDVHFTVEGAVLMVRWSKVIQFRERLTKNTRLPTLSITALLRLTLESRPCSCRLLLFRYAWMGAANVPLRQHRFNEKLKACLNAIGLDASKYSGQSALWGGGGGGRVQGGRVQGGAGAGGGALLRSSMWATR